ncbi:glycerate kinase [Aquimarina sp. ERC-38]|uniref:glycerate kinase n=1 Tax=Aquimarina sp. ERC-38 TaxID=2949996 RepID=UPI002245446B|nr:glycerate kinase [Aquimarina sp. ERC-38]UZO79586.1 glycerate kinase [Aquimarina sp. ERC-38]
MKFIIAPDKYKGSLTGLEFCDAVEKGLKKIFKDADIIRIPLADGGDGTIEVVKYHLDTKTIKLTVNDPLFRPVEASYLYSESTDTAFIEMAEASGLKLLTESEKNCMYTSTLGTGELIAIALAQGAKKIILGIGGSATNDGGMGMAHALGFRFLDKNNKILPPTGNSLIHLKRIDTTQVNPKLKNVSTKVLCDVTNPLYGKNGAAYIYAKQKGASAAQIELLDQGLKNYAKVVSEDFKVNLQRITGAGAAGGMGAGTYVFLNGQLTRGIDLIKETTNFDQAIDKADWIITGEGKLDDQTITGKTIAGVLTSAKKKNISVAALCGIVDLSEEKRKQLGLSYVASVSKDMPNMELAIKCAYTNVVKATVDFASLLKNGKL